MAFMKFYVGTEASVQEHLDGIYLATDTHKIFYNGSAYGGSEVDLSNYVTLDGDQVITGQKTFQAINSGEKSYILRFNSSNRPDFDAMRIGIDSFGDVYYHPYIYMYQDTMSNVDMDDPLNMLNFDDMGVDITPILITPQTLRDGLFLENYNINRIFREGMQLSYSSTNQNADKYTTFYSRAGLIMYKPGERYGNIAYGLTGVYIRDKSSSDLLHAAGGTISINDLKSQLNIPDTSVLQGAIGTNNYTVANYISKETNLTEAVLQLDEEIKATNDNLALEHTNAEATYAKKTEIPDVSNFLTISNAQNTYLTKTDASNTYQPKGNYLTSVSIATVSDLNANWDALLKSDPSGYVTRWTRWPNISEVGSKQNLIIKLNGGTTEGTNKFTYNVTAEKSINITPSSIGAAASSHTHNASQVSGLSKVATSGSYNDLTNKPAIPSAYILPKLSRKEWKRVLLVPTGALLSKVSFNEGKSIPGIAHGVVLECI